MGKYYCCMTNCHNFRGKIGKFNKKVTLHKLTKEKDSRRAWIIAISRKYWKPKEKVSCIFRYAKPVGDESSLDEDAIQSRVPSQSVQSCIVGIQNTPVMCDISVGTSRPDIIIEDIQDSNVDMQFYTGLPNYIVFLALFESLLECGGKQLCTTTYSKSEICFKKRA
ncbi:uncharacterized protein LOC121374651 [Gigantopelta aegis]|uniref:uncharacterized protein LOC121374651 n=1 Tax=Gigantopelta aegis TaxID=1735272 RepID=UPI001B8883E7|nr:uncharacterized protein LOC121374651 [Gigantopelta aegis]